ncbi:putative GATA transcription factor 22 [Fagus crenata]
MSPQSANQASGVNNRAQNPNPSSNQQVDLTLRLGAFGRITINPPPMNPQHAPANFTGTNTDQAQNQPPVMVSGGANKPNTRGQATQRVSCAQELMRNQSMNSNGRGQVAAAVGGGGGGNAVHTNMPPIRQMNEYTLLNPSSRKGNGSSSSRKKNSSKTQVIYNDPNQKCTNYNCGTNNTPMWRKGPLGPKSLCNACGIRYRKEEEKKKAALMAVQNPAPASTDQNDKE